VKAIEGFDPTLGYTFASYAAPTILGELKRHFRDRGRQVHLPRGLQERIAEIDRAVDALPTKLGRAPSAADVAAHTGLEVEEVLEAMEAASARRPYSLDATVGPDEDAAVLADTIGDLDPAFQTVEYGEAIARTLELLPDRERLILNLRFVEDLTQSEIAERIGISQMHVSRLLRRALDAMREQVREPD
jgi:RNA polymerase sigma-B factor